jgi:FdhE protein
MTNAGGPGPELNIGEEARPPYAVLPDVSSLFATRAQRLAALAPGHELEPYLRFLSQVALAQYDIVPGLPAAALPPADEIGRALAHGMPPLHRTLYEPDAAAMAAIDGVLAHLAAAADLPPAAAAAIASLRAATPGERRGRAVEALKDTDPGTDLARRALVMAGLQVHFARLAAQLVAGDLKPIADGVCPACGSVPMTSSVVGWRGAHNTRFCACPLCATQWNVVRIKCVLCSSTKDIGYRSIEGKPDTVKAETCGSCHAYVKILYQVNDHLLEPLADDVATLGLDMMMAEEGWRRGGQNPFLLGY